MTPESKCLALAHALRFAAKDEHGPLYKTPMGWVRDCPDYSRDLNACHEAEWRMSDAQHKVFRSYLFESARKITHATSDTERAQVSATAEQRLDPMLRTLGIPTE